MKVAEFNYRALDANGSNIKGVLVAESRDGAITQLQQQGLIPLKVSEQEQVVPLQSGPKFSSSGHLSNKQITLITRQLATMINAFLPVDEALQVLLNQLKNKKLRNVLLGIQQQVCQGQSLAVSMSKAKAGFPEAYIATIAAGEKSGQLGPVMQRLANYSQVMHQTRSRIQIALIYPTVMVLVSMGVIGLLVVYVVPQVAEVITSMNQSLPAITQGLISLSQFLQQWSAWLVLGILAAMLAGSLLMRQEAVRLVVHRILLTIPGLGYLLSVYMAARFCKTLAMLYDSGSPIVEAVDSAKAVVSNDYLRQHVSEANVQIHDGKGFLAAFSGRPILPPLALHLIASGQANGQLAFMLDKAADDLEQELQNTITALLALIEPLMMLVMGGIVLLIVMAVMVPILDMNQLMM